MHTIKATHFEVTGEVTTGQYGNGTLALMIEIPETAHEPAERITLSVNLVESQGLVPPEGCVYVKAYSGHEGVPEALADVGIAQFVDGPADGVGNYDAIAVLMRVLI